MEQSEGLMRELQAAGLPAKSESAPTMGGLQKVRYTHEAMIDLIVANPWVSQNQIAAHFGYTPAWISNVFASDAFQERLAARREEIVDPALKATLEERFRALVLRSLEVLQEKLNKPVVSDTVALKAAELGAKALGLGGNAPPAAPVVDSDDRLARLAARLVQLQADVRRPVYEGNIQDAEVVQTTAAG